VSDLECDRDRMDRPKIVTDSRVSGLRGLGLRSWIVESVGTWVGRVLSR
jgi:hypothetical protein